MKKYVDNNRNITYIDGIWVDNNLTFGKYWQSDDVYETITNTSS